MRNILLTTTLLVAASVATNALAFGGIFGRGGSGRKEAGVNVIGVHIDANGGNETPNITLANCDAYGGTGLVDNETYNGGYAGLASDNQTQCRCPAGTKWNGSACITSEGATCTSWTTNECGTGYYCQFSPESNEEDPTEGVCQDVSDCGLYAVSGTEFVISNYDGDCSPDWWTAQAICVSQNMQLVHLADLGCIKEPSTSCDTNHINYRKIPEQMDYWTQDLATASDAYWVSAYPDSPYATIQNQRSLELDALCH